MTTDPNDGARWRRHDQLQALVEILRISRPGRYFELPAISAFDEFITDAVDLFSFLSPEERRAFVREVGQSDSELLLFYSAKMASVAFDEGNASLVKSGLIALVIENGKKDFRDHYQILDRHEKSLERLGSDISAVFNQVSELAEGGMRNLLKREPSLGWNRVEYRAGVGRLDYSPIDLNQAAPRYHCQLGLIVSICWMGNSGKYFSLPIFGSAIDRIMISGFELFESLSQAERCAFMNDLSVEHSWILFVFALRMASLGIELQSTKSVHCGLVALLAEGLRFRRAETFRLMCVLQDSLARLDGDPISEFESVAVLAEGAVADLLRDVPRMPLSIRRLESLGVDRPERPGENGYRYSIPSFA